jgi:hypothetical protein
MAETDMGRYLAAMASLPGVRVNEPADPAELELVERWVGVNLPEQHRTLLLTGNGIHACWGYERLLGVGHDVTHLGPWNLYECWKFAWRTPLDDYLCFAQTGFGDQYAYRIADLKRGDARVHRLDVHHMEAAEPSASDDFDAYLNGLFRAAESPSERVVEARRQIGDLTPDELAILSPSPLLVGVERATDYVKMVARVGLSINGDMAGQLLDPANAGRVVERIEVEVDRRDWPRVKIVWA